jgi:fructose-1,6-bisphosphatase/inositol monophosphatase family enzyme
MSKPVALPIGVSGRPALEVAWQSAEEAGRIALARFRRPQQVTVKGRGNVVTATDTDMEAYLRDALAREFPTHALLAEETAAATALGGWVWVVDPLDGTRNYVSGIPFFCVNVALCLDGEPLLALTYDPIHDEAFHAERGGGAWLNGERICASTKATVQESVFAIDLGYDDERASAALALAGRLFPGVQSVRIPGSAALGLAYAACGRYDLFVHHYLFPWDLAAGMLLVKEAGGAISDREGRPVSVMSKVVVAGGLDTQGDFMRWQSTSGSDLHTFAEVQQAER